MKTQHLLNLPNAPAAKKVAQEEDFKPSSTAWLNTVWQNWCTYGPEYPQKNTIIFTTLTRQALPDRRCKNHCKGKNKDKLTEHNAKVADGKNAYEKSKWPKEFVDAVLRACVGEKPYAML
jgi:hypothetical protein